MSASSEMDQFGCCAVCGKTHTVENCDHIKITKHVFDNEIPSRAKLSLPTFLNLHKLADGSYTVIANLSVAKGTKFGPLQADKSQYLDASVAFALKIFSSDPQEEGDYYLNMCNEEKCNWLMFIQSAEYLEEQNLICYQENAYIYYAAIRDIGAGVTLKVWYAPYYGSKMNKPNLVPKIERETALKNIDLNTLIKKQQKIMVRETWTCKFCGQFETSIVLFAKHILKHYIAQRSSKCLVCEKTFRSKKILKRHVKIVHNTHFPVTQPKQMKPPDQSASLSCLDVALGGPLLNDMFTDSTDLQPSFDLNIDNQNLLLDSDDLIVDNLWNENVKNLDHFNFDIDDNLNQFVCDICLRQFTKINLLIMHLRYHTGDFTCKKCLKVFSRNESLKAHLCNLSQQFKCMLCDKKFSAPKHLSRHVQAIHKKKFRCASCGKCYNSNRDLQEHNCPHAESSDREKFICPVCDKTFFRRAYLFKHLKIHRVSNNPNFRVLCEVCGQRLVNMNSYYKHKSIHEKPALGCETCGRKFCRIDTLKDHVLTHRNSPQVACSICHKLFKNQRVLKSHTKSHQTIKPFKCSLCGVTFQYKSSLGRHLTDIHKQEQPKETLIYACPVCDKEIKLRSSLPRHLKRVHLGVQLDLSTVQPKLVSSKSSDVARKNACNNDKERKETDEGRNEWDDQITNLLTDNAIEENAVNSLVEELTNNNKEEASDCNQMNLSVSDSNDIFQDITLDNNAFILDNGTIVQPQGDSNNMIIYVLEQPL